MLLRFPKSKPNKNIATAIKSWPATLLSQKAPPEEDLNAATESAAPTSI